jgi:hypothetical protein
VIFGPDRRPPHLLPFDRYTVTSASTEPTSHSNINAALRAGAWVVTNHRARVAIVHERFGEVAVLRPIGREVVVLWRPHPDLVGNIDAIMALGVVLIFGVLFLAALRFLG